MPRIHAGNLTMNYDQQGSGEPLVLIPYLAADCNRASDHSRRAGP